MGPDRGVSYKRRYRGHMTPRFSGGGALVLPDLPGSVRGSPKSRRQAQRNEIDKWKWACPALFLFFCPRPLSESGAFNMRSFGTTKTP